MGIIGAFAALGARAHAPWIVPGGAMPFSGSGVSQPLVTPLAIIDISDPANQASFTRGIPAGYTGNGDADPYQREAGVDELRISYEGAVRTVQLEADPTQCSLVAPGIPVVTPGAGKFSATYAAIPVTTSLLKYRYKIDAGSWVDNGTSTTLTDITAAAGDHTLSVDAVCTSGIAGATSTSTSFTVAAGFDIASIPGLRAWYKADALTASDADPIASWTDSSGNANHATSSGAARPKYYGNIINGKPILRGDGSSAFHVPFSITAKPCSIFVVAKSIATSATQTLVSLSNTSETVVGLLRVVHANSDQWGMYANGDKSSGSDLTAFHLCSAVVRDYNDIDLKTDGGSIVNITSGTGFYAGDSVNDRRGILGIWDVSGAVECFTGDVAEVLIFDTAVSGSNYTNLISALRTKYAL